MIKTVWFMRRKPGMGREEFVVYYENVHRKMGEKVLRGIATRYVRRHLQPIEPDGAQPVYDVITEICFASRERYEQGMSALRTDEFIQDFMRLFDAGSVVQYLVDEHESSL
jgi:uncharacterized protein (TIGR02118 family)